MVNPISTNVYHTHIKNKLELSQAELTVKYMREIGSPVTANMLLSIINRVAFKINIVSLRRTLHNLTVEHRRKGWLNQYGRQVCIVTKKANCPITNMEVGWYELTPEFKAPQLTMFPEQPLKKSA